MAIRKRVLRAGVRRLQPVIWPVLRRYLAKPRPYRGHGLALTIEPGLFHPGFFFSTDALIQYLADFDLSNAKFLELGAGSGVISLWAARRGAVVTSTDIQPAFAAPLARHAAAHGVSLDIRVTDLLTELNPADFAWIVVNPPYYPRNASTPAEHAWFCGEDFAYFERLFAQVRPATATHVVLVLSEHCDLAAISAIAARHGARLRTVAFTESWLERNDVYAVEPLP